MLELVNPEIIHAEGEQEGWEGCLSVPNQYGWVNRPSSVTVRAQDRDGNFFEVSGEEMVARCFCHELEHLEGHLFVERTDGQLYTMEELDGFLREAGFRWVRQYGDKTMTAPRPGAERVFFTARKDG